MIDQGVGALTAALDEATAASTGHGRTVPLAEDARVAVMRAGENDPAQDNIALFMLSR